MEQQIIRLNLIPSGKMPVAYASQYDKGRKIRVLVFDGTKPYIFDDETVELDVRKSDAHIVTADLSVVSGTSYVDIVTTEQMCAVAGRNECEIRIQKGELDIGSLNFYMDIEGSPLANGLQSDSEINNLRRQIEEIAEPVIEEVAPPIVERIVPEVIGDNYYNKEQTDALLEGKADAGASYTKAEEDILLGNKADKSDTYTKAQVDSALSGKANVGASYTKSEEDALLANKADSADVYNKQTVDNKLAEKANTSDVNTALATKADKADTYTKSQVDSALSGKANAGASYTKLEEDNLLSGKADKADTYTKTEVDNALGNKADKSTTYTKTETDSLVSPKADKSYVDTQLASKANGADVYTKTETDEKISALIDDTQALENKAWSGKKTFDEIVNILPTGTASGSIANFNTSLALPMEIAADVNAVQDAGTPTPATPLPISGRSEINLYKLGGNFFNKNTVTNGLLINASGNEVSYADWNISDFIPVVEGASYYFYGLTTRPNTNQDNFELFNASKVKVGFANVKTNQQPYVIPSGVAYIKCSVKNPDLDTAQLGVSVNASFVPYNPVIEKTVINLGGTYYGGHFTQDKAGHRQFEVTHEIYTFDGTENFGALSSNNRVYTNVLSDAYIPSVATEKCVISTHYVGVSQSQAANGTVYKTTGNSALVFQDDINGVDVATFKAFLANQYASNTPVTVAYKIATPIIIDLPDGEPIITLNGTNNIFADTGDTSVVFKDSVNGYVEKKIANVQALTLNT